MTVNWSKKPFLLGLAYSLAVSGISYFMGKNLSLPWQPISVIGIAVAFYLGFKNNSSYDRTWEARKIWGIIVNNSRAFGAAVVSFVQGENQEEIRRELIYRHIAWITALRHQLRLSKPWEHTKNRLNGLYAPTVCEDYTRKLDLEYSTFLPAAERSQLEGKANAATQILRMQSVRLQQLRDAGLYKDLPHMEFHQLITALYEGQGGAERIKTFPFPRQYASTTLWLTFAFCVFVPFGLLDIYQGNSLWSFWLCPLFSALIIWVFFLMEKIGDYSENPFEGTYNDVPITSIARTIEIDLRQMIGDTDIPEPVEAENGFLL